MRFLFFVAFGLSACFASSLQDVVKSASKSDGVAAKEYLAKSYAKASDAAGLKAISKNRPFIQNYPIRPTALYVCEYAAVNQQCSNAHGAKKLF